MEANESNFGALVTSGVTTEERFWVLGSFPTPWKDSSRPPFQEKQRQAFHPSLCESGIVETSRFQFSSYSWEEGADHSFPMCLHFCTCLCTS